jgi:hypothetical protein
MSSREIEVKRYAVSWVKVVGARALRVTAFIPVFCFLVLLGCSESTTRPSEGAEIFISLSLSAESGQSGDTIVAIASVQNMGIPVLRPVDCRGDGGAFLELLGPDGQVVCPVMNCDVFTMCPSREEAFESGILDTNLSFNGMLWEGSEEFPAPSGTYTVRASFVYRVPGEGQVIEQEQGTFYWDAGQRLRGAS